MKKQIAISRTKTEALKTEYSTYTRTLHDTEQHLNKAQMVSGRPSSGLVRTSLVPEMEVVIYLGQATLVYAFHALREKEATKVPYSVVPTMYVIVL